MIWMAGFRSNQCRISGVWSRLKRVKMDLSASETLLGISAKGCSSLSSCLRGSTTRGGPCNMRQLPGCVDARATASQAWNH